MYNPMYNPIGSKPTFRYEFYPKVINLRHPNRPLYEKAAFIAIIYGNKDEYIFSLNN